MKNKKSDITVCECIADGIRLYFEPWKNGEEVCVSGIELEAGIYTEQLEIPAQLGGKRVTGLKAYAFYNERWLKEISIPDTVTFFGGHCFFDCRKLEKISLSDEVVEIEDGAFKNCENLSMLELRVRRRKCTCLKSILAESTKTIYIDISYPDGSLASVVFPRYLLDFEANVEARIINQVTFGSGLEYRECFTYEDVDYLKYDQLFYKEQHIGETAISARLAVARLCAPYQLSAKAKLGYEAFLQEQPESFSGVLSWYEEHEKQFPALLQMLSGCEALWQMALHYAQEKMKPALVAQLMEIRRGSQRTETMFEL